jgi:hypothetical protein
MLNVIYAEKEKEQAKKKEKINEDEGAESEKRPRRDVARFKCYAVHMGMATGDSPVITFAHSARHSLCFHFSFSTLCTQAAVCAHSRHQITVSVCVM